MFKKKSYSQPRVSTTGMLKAFQAGKRAANPRSKSKSKMLYIIGGIAVVAFLFKDKLKDLLAKIGPKK